MNALLWSTLLVPSAWAAASLARAYTPIIAQNRTLSVPSSAPLGRQIIDAAFQSYSIELSSMVDFAGNLSHPNTLSHRLLQNLFSLSGAHPLIRAGGTTANRAIWVQNQTAAIIATFSPSSPDQPSALTIGPKFMESFHTFPSGTKYIFGLNFGDGDAGLDQTVLEAAGPVGSLGDSLYAFEIGNEKTSPFPNQNLALTQTGWPGSSRRPTNWTVQAYVTQFLQYATAIDSSVPNHPLYQAGAFEAPRALSNPNHTLWNAESILYDGIARTGMVKTIAEHDVCISSRCVRVLLMFGAKRCAWRTVCTWGDEFDFCKSIPYRPPSPSLPNLTLSPPPIKCQGAPLISNVFASALWSIDYVLYVSTLHISRLYFHQGTNYRYSAWQPISTPTADAGVRPLYYGNLFIATAFAGGEKQVAVLINETAFTGYGIYEAGDGRLSGLAVVNLRMWNSTQKAEERPYTAVQVKVPDEKLGNATVRRLTAPGVEIAGNVTWAGRSVDAEGFLTGTEVVEKIGHGNTVLVGAGEAVLITL
ncbi:beta-glucuronidase protein [Rutstroemia sp. NJR-2017a BBW]|nr:beta-glucuronidase protein [Rutstroemia sp. NJR-2017a BBW]